MKVEITNAQNYEYIKEWQAAFEQQLATPLPADDPIDPRARKIQRDAIAATVEEFREAIARYEANQQTL